MPIPSHRTLLSTVGCKHVIEYMVCLRLKGAKIGQSQFIEEDDVDETVVNNGLRRVPDLAD